MERADFHSFRSGSSRTSGLSSAAKRAYMTIEYGICEKECVIVVFELFDCSSRSRRVDVRASSHFPASCGVTRRNDNHVSRVSRGARAHAGDDARDAHVVTSAADDSRHAALRMGTTAVEKWGTDQASFVCPRPRSRRQSWAFVEGIIVKWA